MATANCTINGHVSGYNGYNHSGSYGTGYYYDMYVGANLDAYSNLYLYGYVMKFTTPSFSGSSTSITLNVIATDGFGGSGYPELRYAICSSDANRNSYYNAGGAVSDAYQLTTGTITFGIANGATAMCSFNLPVTGLSPSTTYYIMLWNSDGTGVTIKAINSSLSSAYGTPSVVLNYNAHTHSYSSTVTAPTCTSGGYTTYTCSCGDSYTGNATAALGHSYKSTVTAPTCTAQGYTTYTCSRCGSSYKDNYTAATGHSYSSTVTAPTCTAQGYTTYTCSCGASYKDKYTSALGHSWNSGVVTTEPTYTTDGVMTYTCTRCSTTKTDIIQKLGAGKRFVPVVFVAGEEYIPYVYTSSEWCCYYNYIHNGTSFDSY